MGSYSTTASATTQQVVDTNPPTPNPSTWATAPHATGTTSISMTATTASDPGGNGVQYYFHCLTTGGHDSAWQASATYQDTGLSPNTLYSYQVRTRDQSANQNMGSYSTTASATTQQVVDTNPPTPNPSTWATAPHATGTTSISMTATTASDPGGNGVQYYFHCLTTGGHDSAWQASATYQDTGLSPNTLYSYQVRTRDQSANQNMGSYSTTASATTQQVVDTNPPTPNPSTWATAPHATGTTSISMTATTASDPGGNGVQYYFHCLTTGGHDSAWQASATYQDTGLSPNTLYSYQVRTRDQSANQNMGSYSTTASATTQQVGVTISSVVVAEATPTNGTLDSTDQLVITWAVNGAASIGSKLLSVDGNAIGTVYGPYAGGTGTWYFAGLFGPLGGGSHSYTIQSADSTGNAASPCTGSFTVVGPSVTISGVVVAEATPKNGTLDSTDQLVITWAVNGANTMGTKSLTVDGNPATAIYGPYGSAGGPYYFAGVFGPLGGGSHIYTINSSDANNNTATPYSGIFTVVGLPVAVSSVVVAEATPQNGKLESNEKLVATWGATSTNGTITSQTLTVDGITKTPIYGPYGTYYADVFGPLTAGAHNYAIQSTDSKGNVGNASGSFTVLLPSALMVEASPPPSGQAQPLGIAQLQPIIAEAERRLTAATGIQVTAAMTSVSVQITDLPNNMLGEEVGKTILIDRDAAGYGWFIDPTPANDLEFADVLGPHTLAAGNGSPAAQRVDLLTTVMHEMGHVLGFEHSDSLDLMYPTLPLGTRRSLGEESAFSLSTRESVASGNGSVSTSVLDQVFASFHDREKRDWSMA